MRKFIKSLMLSAVLVMASCGSAVHAADFSTGIGYISGKAGGAVAVAGVEAQINPKLWVGADVSTGEVEQAGYKATATRYSVDVGTVVQALRPYLTYGQGSADVQSINIKSEFYGVGLRYDLTKNVQFDVQLRQEKASALGYSYKETQGYTAVSFKF